MPEVPTDQYTPWTTGNVSYVARTDTLDIWRKKTNGLYEKLLTSYQPLNQNLTDIAALGTTSYGRGLLNTLNATAARDYLGVNLSGFQPLDSDLSAIANQGTTSYGRSLLLVPNMQSLRDSFNLGSMAFQNSNAVSISGGTAALSSLAAGSVSTTLLTSASQIQMDGPSNLFFTTNGGVAFQIANVNKLVINDGNNRLEGGWTSTDDFTVTASMLANYVYSYGAIACAGAANVTGALNVGGAVTINNDVVIGTGNVRMDQRLTFTNMPTSAADVVTGMLYRDGDVVKIKL
jgi:hypothetical protein